PRGRGRGRGRDDRGRGRICGGAPRGRREEARDGHWSRHRLHRDERRRARRSRRGERRERWQRDRRCRAPLRRWPRRGHDPLVRRVVPRRIPGGRMLPSLTVRSRFLDRRRIALGIASALLALAALATSQSATAPAAAQTSLADELHPATWAILVPPTWLAAPVPRVRRGDLLDLFGMNIGDLAF